MSYFLPFTFGMVFFAEGDEYFVVSSGNNKKILLARLNCLKGKDLAGTKSYLTGSILPAPLNFAKRSPKGIQPGLILSNKILYSYRILSKIAFK
jgi:hypothetical protein